MELFNGIDWPAAAGGGAAAGVAGVFLSQGFRSLRLWLMCRLVPRGSRFAVVSGRQALIVFGPLRPGPGVGESSAGQGGQLEPPPPPKPPRTPSAGR